MQKKVFILIALVFSFNFNLFAGESYSKQEIEKMISKMVILGFSGENINPNDEIYKNIKSGLGGVILFDKDDLDVSKGGIFIVSTNVGLFVKRVALKIDGSLELISDNKSYNSEIIVSDELDTIRLLGKVIGKVALV